MMPVGKYGKIMFFVGAHPRNIVLHPMTWASCRKHEDKRKVNAMLNHGIWGLNIPGASDPKGLNKFSKFKAILA